MDDWDEGLGLSVNNGEFIYKPTADGTLLLKTRDNQIAVYHSPELSRFVDHLIANSASESMLWCADERVWLQHQLGQWPNCRGGSLHESGQSRLVSGGNKHTHRRLVLFQRSAVDELSRSFLPTPLAVIFERAVNFFARKPYVFHTPAIFVPQKRHLPSVMSMRVTAKMSRTMTAFLQLGQNVVSTPSRPGTLPI